MDEPAQRDDPGRPGLERPDPPDEAAAAGWGVWTRRELPSEPPQADAAVPDARRPGRPERRPRPSAAAAVRTSSGRPARPARPDRPAEGPPSIRFVWGTEPPVAEVDDVGDADDDPDVALVSRRASVADVDPADARPRRD